jgi:hypothetical protein
LVVDSDDPFNQFDNQEMPVSTTFTNEDLFDAKDSSSDCDPIDMPFEEFRKCYMNADIELLSKSEGCETKKDSIVGDCDELVTKNTASTTSLDLSLEELRKRYRRLSQPISKSASQASVYSNKSTSIANTAPQNNRLYASHYNDCLKFCIIFSYYFNFSNLTFQKFKKKNF